MGGERMRIVGGAWRGRALVSPAGTATRPTSDRVREAVFDALSARLGAGLGGAITLDLFAGTGALGLEALSRGATRCVFVEQDRLALSSLERNATALGAGGRAIVIAGDATGAALPRASVHGPFSLLLVDPPYRMEPAEVVAAIGSLRDSGALAPGALIVVERRTGTEAAWPDWIDVVRTYRYGGTEVVVLERAEE